MATETRHSGTLRTDYESDLAHADELPAMESGWQRLMHRLVRYSRAMGYREEGGREGSLSPLLENHVLTVVADIMRKRLQGYDESFADAQGTLTENVFKGKLENDIKGWIKRLKAFIDKSWQVGQNESSAITAATLISEELNKSLIGRKDETEKHKYYRMLRTVKSIQAHADYYLGQIENSGDVDGALSLLVAYLKNYCSIADTFNNRFSELPALYLNEILHVKPSEVVQDNAYIIVSPTETCTLKAGQGFPAGQNAAGEDLIYRTTKAETVSPVRCTEVNTVYLVKDKKENTTGIRRQAICPDDTANATMLFDVNQGEALAFGWQMESSMFILNEGNREVTVTFNLKRDTANALPPAGQGIKGFTCYMSCTDGWQELEGRCLSGNGSMDFRLTIGQDDFTPTACNEVTHGKTTVYPILRIQTDTAPADCLYDWASRIEIDKVKIRTQVRGIRNFTFCNELGTVDTTQPFQPFGIQADRGAWFLFGNEEIGMKTLTGIHIKGVWQKMPETEKEWNDRYRDYGVDASSFKVGTEWQEKKEWHPCKDGLQPLFRFDEEGKLLSADVYFDFPEAGALGDDYEYSHDKDGFFRITLQSPSIGFGTDAYRRLYTETMIHNGNCKEKNRKALPQEPVVPMLADVELEYEAVETLPTIPEPELFVVSDNSETCFRSRLANEECKALYFTFSPVEGEQTLRMYLDMVIPPQHIPYRMPESENGPALIWEYRKAGIWTALPTTSVTSEETCGLTQSGFIGIRLPEKIKASDTDRQGRMWLRASVKGKTDACLAIRGVWTNCIRLAAQNGDGQPLPAGTIQEMQEADGRIERIIQPLPGFGGKPAETDSRLTAHLTACFGNRHRAVCVKDYEQLVLEHFPEVDKAVCLPCTDKGKREVRLVVFSPSADSRYYLSPSWKLSEIQRTLRQYAPPCVQLMVMNPAYQEIKVSCKTVLREDVRDEGKVVRNLVVLAQNYLAPWLRKGEIPDLQQSFSYKELHSRMVNHEDLQAVAALTVGGKGLPAVEWDSQDIPIKGEHPWNVLIPRIEIISLSPDDGIERAEIGSSFIIK